MTATKVECQELGSDSPRVEEIASYSYTVQEETVQKPQNGVLIEEFSETSEDNRSRLRVNRAVSIVSVSDDESTLKAISRDVSTEDMQCGELSEDLRMMNGSYEEFNGNGSLADEKPFEDLRLYRGTLFTETIMEERSLEEAPSERSIEQTVQQPQRGILGNDGFVKEKIEKESAMEEVVERMLDQPQTPATEESKLKKENLKVDRVNSITEKAVENMVEERRGSLQNGLSRQSSRLERMDSRESMKAVERSVSRQNSLKAAISVEEEVDEELEALLDRVKRQRSVLDDILEKESNRDSGTTGLLHQLLEWIFRIASGIAAFFCLLFDHPLM